MNAPRPGEDFGLTPLPHITVGAILRAVSATWGVSERELLSPRRMSRSVVPRHAAMGLAREMTMHSLPQIGRAMRKDHTTVLKGIQRHAERLAEPAYAARIQAISEHLQRSFQHA